MIEYEELKNDIGHYLMEHFRYRKSLAILLWIIFITPPVEIAG